MQHKMNPLMAQFNDQPALIEEGRSAWLEACLSKVDEASGEFAKIETANDNDNDFWFSPDDYRSYFRPYKVKDGILHVPVKGVLLNNFPYAYGAYATGYEYIWEAVKRGMDDSDVKGIALVIDSGGGLVSGNFALVDKIFALRGRKPIQSFACEHAYSAAYSVASVGDSITVARTGGVGSIGVVVIHMEYSEMLANAGYKTTIIRSKPGKMEGNAYEILSKDAQERIQARVDEFHNQFVAIVARNRGMSEAAVDKTNALTFMAQEAIENGLADAIGTFDDAITAFVATINSEGEDEMADNITQAQVDAQVATAVAAATATAKAEGVTEGKTLGVTDERTRISTILDSDLAKTRPSAARMMVNLGISADAAAIELAKLPEEKPVAVAPVASGAGAPKGMLKAAMAGTEQPGITAAVGDEEDNAPAGKSSVLADLRGFGIDGFKAKKE